LSKEFLPKVRGCQIDLLDTANQIAPFRPSSAADGWHCSIYQYLLSSTLHKELICALFKQFQKRALSMSGRASISNLVSGLGDCLRFMRQRCGIALISHMATAFRLYYQTRICGMIARAEAGYVHLTVVYPLSLLNDPDGGDGGFDRLFI
jgi:hypothetical protein